MTAAWAGAVTDACNAVRTAGFAGTLVRDGAGALGNAPLPANARARGAHAPHYFEVRWRGDVGEGGKVAVCLPGGGGAPDAVVQVDGREVGVGYGISQLTDALGRDEYDWCTVDDSDGDSTLVWLCIPKGERDADGNRAYGSMTCGTPGDSTINVLVAEIERTEEEGGRVRRTVHQFVVGGLVLSSGGGGHPGPFEPAFGADGRLTGYANGLYAYGRRFYETSDMDDAAKVAEGFIGLEIAHATYANDTPDAKVVLIENGIVPLANTAMDKTVLPLYKIKGGQIEVDYRCYLASLAVRE